MTQKARIEPLSPPQHGVLIAVKLFFSIVIPLLSAAAGAAEIFSWVDETGRVNYSDIAPGHGRATVVDLSSQSLTTIGNNRLRTDEKFLLQQLQERDRLAMQIRAEQAARPRITQAPPPEPEYDDYYASYSSYYPAYRSYHRNRYRSSPYRRHPRYRHRGIGLHFGYSNDKAHGSYGYGSHSGKKSYSHKKYRPDGNHRPGGQHHRGGKYRFGGKSHGKRSFLSKRNRSTKKFRSGTKTNRGKMRQKSGLISGAIRSRSLRKSTVGSIYSRP